VQDGSVLRDVDVFTGEHRVATLGHVGLPGEVKEKTEGLFGQELLGIVEVEALSF
jgi:hypothetical protein